MERYADGDEAAFSVLYDELAPRLYRFALRQLRSRANAEDIVQQTLLQMHGARSRFVRGAAVLPWAYAIARRLTIDVCRRPDHDPLGTPEGFGSEPQSIAASPEEALHRRRSEAALEQDVARLPGAWREAFELTKVDGLSASTAAEVLGVTPGTVKIRAHRATVALRKAQAQRDEDTIGRTDARPDKTEAHP
jgi:RNA polymerase sigma-70 factor (ECF subfamily)